MKLKILLVLAALCCPLSLRAQGYAIQTGFQGNANTLSAGETCTVGEVAFDGTLATNDMVIKGGGLMFILKFKSGTPTNILDITLWDGSNLVAKVPGPLPELGKFYFPSNLARGDSGTNVLKWQKYLNRDARTMLGIEGPGSPPDQETIVFGGRSQLKTALHNSIHNLKVDGTNSSMLDEQTRIFVNNQQVPMDFLVAEPTFLAEIPFLKGTIKRLTVRMRTSTRAYGIVLFGITDPTDKRWNIRYITGEDVTENFNPTEGLEQNIKGATPLLSFNPSSNELIVLASPGYATLWISPDPSVPGRPLKIFVPEGGAKFPLEYVSSVRFFRVSQP